MRPIQKVNGYNSEIRSSDANTIRPQNKLVKNHQFEHLEILWQRVRLGKLIKPPGPVVPVALGCKQNHVHLTGHGSNVL